MTVKNNRPTYDNIMFCYKVEWKDDNGNKNCKWFDTYKEGIEFLKTEFPEWFKKHYKSVL